MWWDISFGNRKFPNKLVILGKKRLEKNKEHYLYEIELVDGFEIRYNEYLHEGNEDNLRVHIKGNMRKCQLLPCNKEYYQEPDDYEDGMGIILFPKKYYLLKIIRKQYETAQNLSSS